MRQRPFLNNAHLVGGMLTLAFGGFVLVQSAGYSRGTVLRMGPGFFPTMVGLLLLALGLILLLVGLRGRDARIARPELRSLAAVLGGLAVFALVLPRYGLGPAIVLMVLLAAFASPSSRPLTAVLLSGVLAALAWVIFVWLLALPIRMLVW